jgi:hypothetical protein
MIEEHCRKMKRLGGLGAVDARSRESIGLVTRRWSLADGS